LLAFPKGQLPPFIKGFLSNFNYLTQHP